MAPPLFRYLREAPYGTVPVKVIQMYCPAIASECVFLQFRWAKVIRFAVVPTVTFALLNCGILKGSHTVKCQVALGEETFAGPPQETRQRRVVLKPGGGHFAQAVGCCCSPG